MAAAECQLVSALSDTSGTVGESLRLSVSFRSTEPPRVEWLRNGQPISDSRRLLVDTSASQSECSLRELRLADAGVYTVRLFCGQRLCHESSARVTVRANSPSGSAPRVVQPLPKQQTLTAGRQLQLRCQFAGSPRPAVEWTRGGAPLRAGGADVGGDTAHGAGHWLRIAAVRTFDAGRYVAVATNAHGSAQTHCDLRVSASDLAESSTTPAEPRAPYFSQEICEHLEVHMNDQVTVQCAVHGHPRPVVTWWKAGVRLPRDDSVVLSAHGGVQQLTIPHVQQQHAGQYTIAAVNALGLAECRCELRVMEHAEDGDGDSEAENGEAAVTATATAAGAGEGEAPEFAQVFHDVFCDAGGQLLLRCDITGCPQPQVTWSFNGRRISGSDSRRCISSRGGRHELRLLRAQTADAGRYCVTAESCCGSATCAALVIVRDESGAESRHKVIQAATAAANARPSQMSQQWTHTPNSLLLAE